MKTSNRGGMLAVGLWGLLALLSGLAACTPLDGSETNWFRTCDADQDCANGSSCVCGTCSIKCSAENTCADVSPNFRCSDGSSSAYAAQCGGPAPVEQGICLIKCAADSDCGVNRACADGACVVSALGSYTEPLVLADTPPAPISGGTLAILAQGQTAAVSDSDRDQVVLVDLTVPRVTATVPLFAGDEPGRLVEDARGRVHVALRGGGALASIDAGTGSLLSRRAVCQYPRGIAYDPATDLLHVACAGGELVSVSASGGAITRTLQLDDDLRDVVVYGDKLVVSRFRSAEVLVLDSSGTELWRSKPLGTFRSFVRGFQPAVAWRLISAAPSGVLIVHQEVDHVDEDNLPESSGPLPQAGSWGGELSPEANCNLRVRAAVTLLDPTIENRVPMTVALLPTVLPVDIAFRAEDAAVAVASAAAHPASRKGVSTGRSFSIAGALVAAEAERNGLSPQAVPNPIQFCVAAASTAAHPPGQTVALAYDGSGRLITQMREPSSLTVGLVSVPLPGPSRRDTGHELFHLSTASGLACASCHPEGGDDGHTWNLVEATLRRTQSLIGGIAGTEPLHWNGDFQDLHSLMPEVMTLGMRGPRLKHDQVEALSRFINAIPPWLPPAVADVPAVERGRTLFESASVGCASCHGGSRFTNNATVDVGTGGLFQVPSLLGISRRAPFMHNGCAETLHDRFTACGGGDAHGVVSQLDEAALTDLVTYLRSL